MESLVIDVQRGSIHDGPGVRMTVFLKGCPLKCSWCHNPESQNFNSQLSFIKSKCSLCLECFKVCTNNCHRFIEDTHYVNFEECKKCGKCVDVCLNNSLKIIGKNIQIDELVKLACKDKNFYKQSGGGITLSGGEPLSHKNFAVEFLRKCKDESIHTCVETSGYSTIENLQTVIKYTDLFYFDWKISNQEDALKYLGQSLSPIKKSLEFLMKQDANVLLRCPIIPSVNDTNEHFDYIIYLLNKYPKLLGAQLLPYHNLGVGKNANIGYESNSFSIPTKEQINLWINYFSSRNISKVRL